MKGLASKKMCASLRANVRARVCMCVCVRASVCVCVCVCMCVCCSATYKSLITFNGSLEAYCALVGVRHYDDKSAFPTQGYTISFLH